MTRLVALLIGFASLPVAGALTARAADAPPAPAPATVVMAPGCKFVMHSGRIRPGDNVPVRVALRNTQQWCFGGFSLSGTSSSGTHVVDQPDHGELRLIVRPEGMIVAYRPKVGFTGSDSFLVAVPSGYGGYDINYAASVTVAP